MHPGPIIRGLEITGEVADGPQSAIEEQVSAGVGGAARAAGAGAGGDGMSKGLTPIYTDMHRFYFGIEGQDNE